MEGTIAIQEKRSVVDKFKSWYKEKMIDSGTSAKMEEFTVTAIDLAGDGMKIYMAVAGAVIAIIPTVFTEGAAAPFAIPLGGFVAATGPAIMELLKNFGTKLYVKGKRATEGLIVGEDGASENVQIPDIDLSEDAKKISKEVIKEAPGLIDKYLEMKKPKTDGTQPITDATQTADVQVEVPTETSLMKM